ncbi:MAG: D-hexose-6-phosphate mutarotase, partial [Lentisphaeria bacterium]
HTFDLFPYKFLLTLTITIGSKLELNLTTANLDSQNFTVGGAFHTYLPVLDISKVSILGLEKCTYIDATDKFTSKIQNGPITFNCEVDRIYTNTSDEIILNDNNNSIIISRRGSNSAVIWNPWIEKGKSLSGFAPSDYTQMVCIEATNALDDVYLLTPNTSHSLYTSIIG